MTDAYTDSYGFDDYSPPDPRSEGFPVYSDTVPQYEAPPAYEGNGFDFGKPEDFSWVMNPQFGLLTPQQESDLNESLKIFSSTPQKDLPSILDDGSFFAKVKRVADTLGLTKEGKYDWGKILGLGAAGITAYDTLNRQQVPVKSVSQLVSQLPSNTPGGFSPTALAAMQVPMKAGTQLTRQSAAEMPSPIQLGVKGYAEGGEVDGPLSQAFEAPRQVIGEGGGQDDMVEARLSPGEYVFDAESVSMLGDGDNAAGARKLDELRAAMRAHKRSAPPDEIAPRSLGPLSYMKGGLNG